MSQRGEELYGKYGIHGSSAYDFKGTDSPSREQYGRRKEASSRKKIVLKDKPAPSLCVACILCAVFLTVGLVSQSSLIILSQETAAAQKEMEELLDEQTILKIRHEMTFSLAETEKYAIDVLGMQKPSAAQVSCIDIVTGEEDELSFAEPEERDFTSIFRAYFPG